MLFFRVGRTAFWGCPPQTPTRGMIPLDPLSRLILNATKKAASRCCLNKTAKLDAVMLLARRLKAANPDAKHPGKARK